MEVKINREIRDYTESMFFGLSMRQFFFSLAALGVAVLLYFVLRHRLGTETVSWMCILGAVPFAAMGFIKYHGMPAEKALWAFIRSEFLEPKEYWVKTKSLYYELTKTSIGEHKKNIDKNTDKEGAIAHDEIDQGINDKG